MKVLITGVAEGGLGEETALSIATASPELLILSARSKARAQPVATKLSASYPQLKVQILEMDLGSLASVRKAAAEVAGPVDVLINNAAVMGCPYSTTSDGVEM
jgi:short-subunit dehydrogenase